MIHGLRSSLPQLADFVDRERDGMELCSFRAPKKNLGGSELYRLACSNLFISTTKKKKLVSENILFWNRSVVGHAYESATEDDCRAVMIKDHEVCKICTFLQEVQCNPSGTEGRHLVLMNYIPSLLLRGVIHRFMDTFSIGPVVAPMAADVVTLILIFLCCSVTVPPGPLDHSVDLEHLPFIIFRP